MLTNPGSAQSDFEQLSPAVYLVATRPPIVTTLSQIYEQCLSIDGSVQLWGSKFHREGIQV